MSERTPLFAAHLASGARIVDFGGWDMPLHYGSQLDEHHAVRMQAGVFDVSHMRVADLDGPAAGGFLRRLLANDVARLVPGKALYSCMLRPDGGVIDDLITYCRGPDQFRLVLNAGCATKDLAWIRSQALEFSPPSALSVTERRDLALIAVQGPQARDVLCRVLPAAADLIRGLAPFTSADAGSMFIARTGYTGEDGCEIALPADQALNFWDALVAARAVRCGLGARDTLRLEAGMNLYGQDMDETVTPLESGLAWTVDLRAGRDFLGRSALVEQGQRGRLRRLCGLVLRDRSAGVLRAHQRVLTADGEGEITSGGFSPTLSCSIALARLPAGVADGATVEVEIRGRKVPVAVVKPPFVRLGKILV